MLPLVRLTAAIAGGSSPPLLPGRGEEELLAALGLGGPVRFFW